MPKLKRGAKHPVTVTVNGKIITKYAEPRMLLCDFLRQELGMTDVHVGCEHGVCGACTVRIDGKAARSCLTFAVQASGHEVRTIESLAAEDGTLHPLQAAFQDCHALQCGYCTPGFIIAVLELLDEPAPITRDLVRERLSGNLCRCTGYQNIISAVMSLLENET